MKKIPLTQGRFAFVDDEDFDRINQYKWHTKRFTKSKTFYAVRVVYINGKQHRIYMHRFIMGLDDYKIDKRIIDHDDHNGENNQKYNLKITDTRGNAGNREDQSKYGAGVSYKKDHYRTKPFQLLININGNIKNMGHFKTSKEAQNARKEWIDKNLDKDKI